MTLVTLPHLRPLTWMATGALMMTLAMGAAPAPPASTAPCRYRQTDRTLAVDNGRVRLEFDRGSGALVGIHNLVTGGEYLKDPSGDGNPFRAYVNTTETPRVLQLAFPWPVQPVEGAMGGMIVDPGACRLTEHRFRRAGRSGELTMISHSQSPELAFELTVRMPDTEVAVDLHLAVRNTGTKAIRVMAAMPYLTGLGLGADRSTNQGVRLVGFGQSRGAAWENIGDLYGRIWSGQWNAVYEPSSREALGLIAMDRDLQNKVVRRFPGGGMSILYTTDHALAPGESVRFPAAQLLVYEGDWKPTARRYGRWFASAFPLRKHARWLDDVDSWMGSWIPKPSDVATSRSRPDAPSSFASYEQFPRLYLRNTFDLQEWAQYWQGVVVHNRYDAYHHTDAIYDLRDDLGGLPAFAEGVARVQRLGRVVGLYIASKTIRNDSRIFSGEFAGTRPEDWMLMETPDAKLPGPDHEGQLSFWACPRYAPWQDHLARLCKDLLRRTGAKYIRLDELGESFVVCHNPKHRHADPYVSTPEMLELLRKVRAAMDEVDPQAALFTEGAADLMQIYCDGTLAMWAGGREIAPMRLVLPGFVGLAYNLGQVECALQGWATYVTDACSNGGWWNPHHAGLWGSGLVKRPGNYPPEGQGAGPSLRWHELGASFVEAVRRGSPADSDPIGIGQDPDQWSARIWKARDYWLMVCGDLAARRPAKPVRVRVPGLPDRVRSAYEIDMATLALREAEMVRDRDGATVSVTSGFSAVLLPLPECPPLIWADETPTLTPGGSAQMQIEAFAPWRSSRSPVSVAIAVPGLAAGAARKALPATLELVVPPSAEAGWYQLTVSGKCLPLKRWIRVMPSDERKTP